MREMGELRLFLARCVGVCGDGGIGFWSSYLREFGLCMCACVCSFCDFRAPTGRGLRRACCLVCRYLEMVWGPDPQVKQQKIFTSIKLGPRKRIHAKLTAPARACICVRGSPKRISETCNNRPSPLAGSIFLFCCPPNLEKSGTGPPAFCPKVFGLGLCLIRLLHRGAGSR